MKISALRGSFGALRLRDGWIARWGNAAGPSGIVPEWPCDRLSGYDWVGSAAFSGLTNVQAVAVSSQGTSYVSAFALDASRSDVYSSEGSFQNWLGIPGSACSTSSLIFPETAFCGADFDPIYSLSRYFGAIDLFQKTLGGQDPSVLDPADPSVSGIWSNIQSATWQFSPTNKWTPAAPVLTLSQ